MRYRLNDYPDTEPERRNPDRRSNSGYPAGGHTYTRERDPYGRPNGDEEAGEHAADTASDRGAWLDGGRKEQQGRFRSGARGHSSGGAGLSFPYQTQPRRAVYPKGYVRSDEYIEDDLCVRLSRSGLDVADVSVAVQGGTVRLSGSVPSRWIKHAVEDAAGETRGVIHVDNRIRVGSPDEFGGA